MYLLVAFIISLVTVFIPVGLPRFLDAKNHGLRLVKPIVSTILVTLFFYLMFWFSKIGFYGPTPYSWWAILGLIIGCIIAGTDQSTNHGIGLVVGLLFMVVLFAHAAIIVGFFQSSDICVSPDKAKVIGDVKSDYTTVDQLIQPADNSHICLVSEGMAIVSAQNALSQVVLKDGAIPGSRYNIGAPTKQFADGSYWWIFPLEFKDYFKWKADPQIPGYLRVSAEDPYQKPQAIQYDKTGQEIHIKYATSASFGGNAYRYLRENGYLNYNLQDWTFEIDDNWRPYYTISVINQTIGYAGEVTTGLITIDLQTGDIKQYDINDVPQWVDRIVPLEVIDTNAKTWGAYSFKSWWGNLINSDMRQNPTPGWYLTYDGDRCQWFTGFTSNNEEDHALSGFMMVDARTGKASFYRASGVTEDLALTAALSLWNNFSDYTTAELVPYNIYGYLTYVVSMKCDGNFTGVSLVCLDNINIKAKGETLEEALKNYRMAITNSAKTSLTPTSGLPDQLEVTGTVERISLPIIGDQMLYIKLSNIDKVFQISVSDTNPKIALVQVGDIVKITYSETQETVVPADDFDIPSLVLAEGSITQATKVANTAIVNAATDLVTDQQTVQAIINSDKLNGVDPNALLEFIEEQENNGN